jgi:hypothetical protein
MRYAACECSQRQSKSAVADFDINGAEVEQADFGGVNQQHSFAFRDKGEFLSRFPTPRGPHSLGDGNLEFSRKLGCVFGRHYESPIDEVIVRLCPAFTAGARAGRHVSVQSGNPSHHAPFAPLS